MDGAFIRRAKFFVSLILLNIVEIGCNLIVEDYSFKKKKKKKTRLNLIYNLSR